MELFQTQIRDSYVEMQCMKVSKQATKEFLQMRAVLQRWRGLGTRAVFEAWHEVARASRLDTNAVKARAERKKLLEKQNKELEEQLARIEARLWVQRSDMYTDAIYYENEQTGETRWEPPQYWAEEQKQKQQQRKHSRVDSVPRLKLPPI
ncbi:Suppressor of SWI4 1 [Phytophthora nicotianae]|nr:Suppressor of SWI4 1 [Phytophthora nicotianae]